MYAMIYDENDPNKPMKQVISVHKSRAAAEKALDKRMQKLGIRVWECDARIVWTDNKVRVDDLINPKDFSIWRPGEKIPEGERFSDAD